MIKEELEALQREILIERMISQVYYRRPELMEKYDFPENGQAMGNWLVAQDPPLELNVENLVKAFDACKVAGLLKFKETEAEQRARERAEVEQRIRKEDEARRAAMVQENDRKAPVRRISHVEAERKQAEELAAERAAFEATKKRYEEFKTRVLGAQNLPVIYYPETMSDGRADPRHGKINWPATIAERKRLGLIAEDEPKR